MELAGFPGTFTALQPHQIIPAWKRVKADNSLAPVPGDLCLKCHVANHGACCLFRNLQLARSLGGTVDLDGDALGPPRFQ